MDVKALRRIKHVCSLGIGGRTLIPVLLPEIRKFIASYSSTFLWFDKTYKFTNVYDESPASISVLDSYLNGYLDNHDQEAHHGLGKWVLEGGVTTTDHLAHRQFYHSAYYSQI